MSEDNQEQKPQIELSGDDDWKDRVKAEDAKRDEEAKMAASEEGQSEKHINFDELPPASFSMMVQMFSTQAMVALGVIPSPDGKQVQQLPLAKHFVDLLAVLDEKCRGNLDEGEAHLLEQSLHELRLAYVQLSGKKG